MPPINKSSSEEIENLLVQLLKKRLRIKIEEENREGVSFFYKNIHVAICLQEDDGTLKEITSDSFSIDE